MFGVGTIGLVRRGSHAFDEEAFHHLLDIHRRRIERAHQPFLLVLIEVKEASGRTAHIEPAVARKLFASLCRALRETDVVGWYRNNRIAGALLVERPEDAVGDLAHAIAARIDDALARGLDAGVARRLRIHVRQVHPDENMPCTNASEAAARKTTAC